MSSLDEFNKNINLNYAQGRILEESLRNPQEFWLKEATENVSWVQEPKSAFRYPNPSEKYYVDWFPEGTLNICYNAVDRHVNQKGRVDRSNQAAIIYKSPVTKTEQVFTYAYLLEQVKGFAKVLVSNGVGKGDTVCIYMPMIPQTIIAMLACARVGAIHSVVFGGFAPAELAKRIDDCKPKVFVSATCGIEGEKKIINYKELFVKAMDIAKHEPPIKVIFQRDQLVVPLDHGRGYRHWSQEMGRVSQEPDATVAIVESSHPLYILYTSGTTAAPKGVIRPSGPHAVMLSWTMKNLYGIDPGEVYFCTSDLGWVVGHTYICYAPLIYGCTTVLFEGKPIGTPDPGVFFKTIEETKASIFFTAPTAMMVLRREDKNHEYRRKYDCSSVKGYFFAGERCVPEIHKWWINHTKANKGEITKDQSFNDVTEVKDSRGHSVDHWWQTESGSPITGICIGTSKDPREIAPVRFGSAGMPLAGVDLRVLKAHEDYEEEKKNASMEEANVGEAGNIVIKLPLPPGFMSDLYNNKKRYFESYFERFDGYYDTGDVGYVDNEGYVYIMSRDDDIINVAAHRLSTSALEEVAVKEMNIAEVCVVPKPDEIRGSVPMVFGVLNNGVSGKDVLEEIKRNISKLVREQVGAIANVKAENVVFVPRLPKTRSGKILRKMIRAMVAEADKSKGSSTYCLVATPPTIDDAVIKDEIWDVIFTIPDPKGSENNFSQRDSDPSMKFDKHEEAKAKIKELSSEITQHLKKQLQSKPKTKKSNQTEVKNSDHKHVELLYIKLWKKKLFTELLKKHVRGLGVEKTKSETVMPAPISDIQKIINSELEDGKIQINYDGIVDTIE
ncbi:hypothetical protein BB559_005140, partial [Furculomyces boomerangus]